MREESIDGDGEGTISPILPIELTLTIYGNTYLQIGDRFTINYLPDFYKDRVDFQIVGIEDTVDPNGWSTVYQTVMRVNPSKKSIITGDKGISKKPKTHAQNPEKNPMDKLTSSLRLFDDLPAKLRAAVKAITQHHELLPDLNENEKEELLKYYINMTNENYETVLREINFFSLQRNLKILGIFSRLSIRDGKERYLKYFPATFNFIKSNLKSSLFFDMKKWIEELQIKELQL